MAKKIRSYHQSKLKKRRSSREDTSKLHRQDDLDNQLLSLLYKSKNSRSPADLDNAMGAGSPGEKAIRNTLDSLCHENLVCKDGKKRYLLHKTAPVCQGVLSLHPKGFGFVDLTSLNKLTFKHPSRDPFISVSRMAGAHHGDTVLIRIIRTRQDDRPEASVISILSQASSRIGGIFLQEGDGQFVYPDDHRFPFSIRIDRKDPLLPDHGAGVIAEYTRSAIPSKVLHGKIVRILGPADTVDTQMRLVGVKFDLPHQFSDKVLQETEALDESMRPDSDRVDLRAVEHITIDGESAKDFDDAIALVKIRKGFQLFVSIADVSYFVREGSAIDREAYARGTSIYFPGRVIPMLPEKLSNDLCSLVENEDRMTVSAILEFDHSGNRISKNFCRSIIRSRKRFTYTTVKKILIDKDPAARREHASFLTQLEWAQELAAALMLQRRKRGSLTFNLVEPEFLFNEEGGVELIRQSERNFAHQIIEEFMLAANEAVAELFTQRSYPALYRVHEPPKAEEAEEFTLFARAREISLPPFDSHPAWFAAVLDHFRGSTSEYVINNLLLRSMKQAHYSAQNVGHFGLGATDYTHFTSPIRRYPDLMVHRALLSCLSKGGLKTSPPPKSSLKEAGEFLSSRERVAVSAERDMHDRLKVSYMKNHIGDSFDAIISGVTENNLFVEIPDHCVSGAIGVETLDDDYYIYDGGNYRLFGEISAKTYQLGDTLRVTLVAADTMTRRVQFKTAQPAARKK
jgi:ribonuclease R